MLNEVNLIGNVGKLPDIRVMQNEKRFANFSLATSQKWKDKNTGEIKQIVEWHNIVVYKENLIKYIEKYISKGSKLYIKGSIHKEEYTDQNGNKKFAYKIVVKDFEHKLLLLDSNKQEIKKEEQTNIINNEDTTIENIEEDVLTDDDIPF